MICTLYHIHTPDRGCSDLSLRRENCNPLLSWLAALHKQNLRKFPGNISPWSCTTRQVSSLAPDFRFLISVQSPTQQSHSQWLLAWKWAKFGPSNGGELSECFSLLEENLSSFVVRRDWAGLGRNIFYLSPPTRPSLCVPRDSFGTQLMTSQDVIDKIIPRGQTAVRSWQSPDYYLNNYHI